MVTPPRLRLLRQFLASEAGAITVDWVVLTATVVGLGLAVVLVVVGGVNDATHKVTDTVSTASTAVPDVTSD